VPDHRHADIGQNQGCIADYFVSRITPMDGLWQKTRSGGSIVDDIADIAKLIVAFAIAFAFFVFVLFYNAILFFKARFEKL
jgi:hypothetical protein